METIVVIVSYICIYIYYIQIYLILYVCITKVSDNVELAKIIQMDFLASPILTATIHQALIIAFVFFVFYIYLFGCIVSLVEACELLAVACGI